MIYVGAKSRIVKYIKPLILRHRLPNQPYIEPFAGGMNVICEISNPRIANDINTNLIEMWKSLMGGWKPGYYTKEEYDDACVNPQNYEPYELGWLAFICSYRGKEWGGYSGRRLSGANIIRDYQRESYDNLAPQIQKLKGIEFSNVNYQKLNFDRHSLIYCDPPYYNTQDYNTPFYHSLFWEWVRDLVKNQHLVYISEYSAPNDFVCIWSKTIKSQLNNNTSRSRECLFVHHSHPDAYPYL